MIVGVTTTVKVAALVLVPPGVVTASLPLVAPAGTMAAMCVSSSTLNVAALPLRVTSVAPVKPRPTMVTLAPTGPEVGVKRTTVGAGGAVMTPALTAIVPRRAMTMPPSPTARPTLAWAEAAPSTCSQLATPCVRPSPLPIDTAARAPTGSAKVSRIRISDRARNSHLLWRAAGLPARVRDCLM